MRDATEFIHLHGMRLACHYGGEKNISVVFLHGNSCSGRTFARQFSGQLAKKHGLLAIDLPGHGLSSEPVSTDDYSLESSAGLVRDVLSFLNLTNIILVGWSLGGHIALQTSLLFKEIKGILIYGTPPHGKPLDVSRGFLPNEAIAHIFQGKLTAKQAQELARSFFRAGSDADIEPFVRDMVATSTLARPAFIDSTLNKGRYEDEQSIVYKMKIPLAILHGEGDQLVNGKYFASLDMPTLWRSGVQKVSGAGHAIHWEQPYVFNTLLGEFIADCIRA